MRYFVFLAMQWFMFFGFSQSQHFLFKHETFTPPDIKDAEETGDGGIVACFNTMNDLSGPSHAGLLKLDASGILQWSMLLQISNSAIAYASDVAVKSDDSFFLTGMTIDSNGVTTSFLCDITSEGIVSGYTEFTNGVSASNEYSDNCIELLPGDDVILLATHSEASTLLKLNSDASINWAKTIVSCEFDCPALNIGQLMDVLPDQSIVRTNYKDGAQGFIKYDISGNVIWQRYFQYPNSMRITDLDHGSDNEIYAIGSSKDSTDYLTNIYLMKIASATGDLIWTKKIADFSFYSYFHSAYIDDHSSGLICTSVIDDQDYGGPTEFAFEIDYNGNMIGAGTEGPLWFPGAYNRMKHISAGEDIIYGQAFLGEQFGLLVRTDEPFSNCFLQTMTLTIQEDTMIHEVAGMLLESPFNTMTPKAAFALPVTLNQIDLCDYLGNPESSINEGDIVFSNPVSATLNAIIPESCVGSLFYVYDITGKCLSTGMVSSETFAIDVSNLLDGMYLLKLQNTFVSLTKKFVVEH